MQVFEKIRNENVGKYGTESSRVMNIIINQYSDRTHFIYEILQNAEDADATRINFKLHPDCLEIIHNGRLFNERDIVGVCGIADGTKEDGSRIGHFGIGFKSVYGYTLTPEIYSGEYSFRIETQLFPHEITRRSNLDSGDTCILLPFDRPQVSAKVAFEEIKNALEKKITAESILILDKIEDIIIEIDGNRKRIEINKQKGSADPTCPENVFNLNLMTSYVDVTTEQRKEQDSDYILFTDAEEEAVSVVFKVDNKTKEIQEVENSKIYAFFPTAKEAHQSFYIHAPFDTTPARDNFKEGSDFGRHNIELIHNIGDVIQYAFVWLRDMGYLNLKTLNKVFPIYKYADDDILYYIYENSVEMIREGDEPILPANNGSFCDVKDLCISENMNITDVIEDSDLQQLAGNRKLHWLAKEITTNAYAGLKRFLDDNFELKKYEWKDIVPKMDARYLASKSTQWMEKLFIRIESYCSATAGGRRIKTDDIPFVRLNDGTQIPAKEKGKSIVYLNNPAVCKYKIHADFLKSSEIKKFYQYALGIQEYNIVSETLDRILPKYDTENVAFVTSNPIKENIEDLHEIRNAMQMDNTVKERAQGCFIVMSEDGKWCRPDELYIKTNETLEECRLIKGIIDVRYVANQYFDDTVLNNTLDERFFKSLGCVSGLRMRLASKDEYLVLLRKYCGADTERRVRYGIFNKEYRSSKITWECNYEGFPEVFSNMTFEKSLSIAKFINRNMRNIDIQGEIIGADDKNFAGKNVDSETIYSMIGLQLAYEKWIYVDEDSAPVSPLDIDQNQIHEKYQKFTQLIKHLPFKQVSNVITEFIRSVLPEGANQEMVIRCMNGMMANPDDFVKMAKSWEQSEAKKGEKNKKPKDIEELLNKGNVNQAKKEEDTYEFDEANPIGQKALDRRSQKLEEAFKESLEQDVRVHSGIGISFANRAATKEERAFLENEYLGRCQICKTKIEKHDNTPYFEAINIIKQNMMNETLTHSLELGWNTLCLCPNCAAEYNYCSKKISDIYEQVMNVEIEPGSDEWIQIKIEMPIGEERNIRYSPRHMLAMKTAFEVFAKNKN